MITGVGVSIKYEYKQEFDRTGLFTDCLWKWEKEERIKKLGVVFDGV